MTTRREALTLAVPAIAAVSGWPVSAAACNGGGGVDSGMVTRERFDEYLALYNAGNTDFCRFYTEDIVMESSPPLVGRQAIVDFVAGLRSYLSELVRLERYVAGQRLSAAQVLVELRCHREMPVTAFGGLFGQAVRPGQVLRQRGIVVYGVDEGRFTFIRAGLAIQSPA